MTRELTLTTYGDEPIKRRDDGSETTEQRCRNCGRHVTPQFARVFGDNSDVVHGCVHCTTSRERQSGDHID